MQPPESSARPQGADSGGAMQAELPVWAGPGFFKAVRSNDGLELIAIHPPSFVLLYVIAHRANWHGGFNRHNLKQGQAFVGDYKRMGMTEREYRTAKQNLEKHGFATFTATSKGTIATLLNTRVFDINIQQSDEQKDGQPTDSRRASDGQPTTNEEVKKVRIKEGKEVRTRFQPPTLEEIKLYESTLNKGTKESEAYYDYWVQRGWVQKNGRTVADWKAAFRTWLRNAPKFNTQNAYGNRPQNRNTGTLNDQHGTAYSGLGKVA